MAYIAEPVDRRRTDLRQRYFFLCKCELCEEASKVTTLLHLETLHMTCVMAKSIYPIMQTMDPRGALKCPTSDCQGAIPPPKSLDVSDVYEIACGTCEKIVHLDASYINNSLYQADKLYDLSKDLESQVYSYFCLDLSTDLTHAIQNLLSALSLRSSLLHHSHESLLRTHQRLKDLYTRAQDWPSAYRHSRALLDIYYAVYPRNHPLIGVQNLASAKMLLAFEDNFGETFRLLREAAEVLGIAYGKEHAMTRTARGLMGEVEREVDLRRG
ncbi:hypothetical protein BC937DRAFT_90644 [Endogone sp. FLAS-F59071]|nr:hypothetical protein BC937DRAFT_90644 [Endogone sp. FLAS-F59071]|eukprot:RUS22013.1 hypothetical protein BC937DRAFT_90644 [Endogone sp. FLAS-F59071]